MLNGCSQSQNPAVLPRLALQTVWYVDADATYHITRRMMQPQGGDYVALRTLQGTGELRLTNGRVLAVPQASLLWVRKERIAAYRCKHTRWLFFWLEFQTIDELALPCETIFELPLAVGEEFELQRCYDLLRGQPESAMAVLAQALFHYRAMDWLFRQTNSPCDEQRKTDEMILLLSQGIREHLSVAQLAKKACLCERSFRIQVKRLVGKTPKEYMLDDMLLCGFSLLRTTNRTVGEIALSIGFETVSSFTRAFQNRFGISPSNARKLP